MYIDKYKIDDKYYDELDCEYDDPIEFYHSAVFKFCGCGSPEDSLKHIQKSLHLIKNMKEQLWTKKILWDEWNEQVKIILPNDEIKYFTYYWLDSQKLTEHGGSVPGWLTKYGEETLSDLNEIFGEA
jgi:hypothetical protein